MRHFVNVFYVCAHASLRKYFCAGCVRRTQTNDAYQKITLTIRARPPRIHYTSLLNITKTLPECIQKTCVIYKTQLLLELIIK